MDWPENGCSDKNPVLRPVSTYHLVDISSFKVDVRQQIFLLPEVEDVHVIGWKRDFPEYADRLDFF
jgi:hypothetical protein